MRIATLSPALIFLLGSCSSMSGEGIEVQQWNARLSAPVSYTGEVDIDGASSSVTSDLDESSFGIALEAEMADGWAPFFEYARGSWNFDWPVEVDFTKFTVGSRFYMDDIAEGDSLFANTRPYAAGAFSVISPDQFLDGAERHRMTSGMAITLGTGLQRDFGEDLFIDAGLQMVFGQLDESIRNEVTSATANTDWAWNDVQLLFSIGKRF